MPFPNFLIIGETKCGTTSLYDSLIKHPQVLPSKGNGSHERVDSDVPIGVKEIRFFDKHYSKGWDWYRNCFPKCPKGCITGEATPMYLYRTQALVEIRKTIQNCKIIVLMRNPTDRLYSHFNHISANEKDWIERYPSMYNLLYTAHPKDYHLIERGFYIKQLISLFCIFKREDVHLMIFEDMISDPHKELKKLLAFLELDYVDLELAHSRKRINNLVENQFRTEINDMYSNHNMALEEALRIKNLWR